MVANHYIGLVVCRFLLPALHISIVLEKPTKADRREALAMLPLELNDAYAGMLARIQKSARSPHPASNLGMRVLMWLHLATRPLLLKELQHALAVVLEEGKRGNVDLDKDQIPTQKRLLDCCLGLVIVDEETMTVRFVHYTLEGFFERDDHSIRYFPDHHKLAAQICLTYLNFNGLPADYMEVCESDEYAIEARRLDYPPDNLDPPLKIRNELFGRFTFLDYAANHWGQHAAQPGCSEAVEVLAMKLLRDKSGRGYPHIALLVLQRSLDAKYMIVRGLNEAVVGMHAAGYFGLESYMIELGKDYGWDPEDDRGRTPLSWAAALGHEGVVRLLAGRVGVQADSKDFIWQRTPLSWAAGGGHEAVVRLLVAREDVAADSKDGDGQTPLAYAADSGHEAVVRLLVAREDVAADSKNEDGQTPLACAAGGGHEAVVRLLVARGDVAADSKANYGQTPLACAAESGQEAVVRLLVAREDVAADSKNDYGQTPLSLAASCGHEAVVRLLVVRGDVAADSKDKDGRTPLSWAAGGAHEAVVQLLLGREDVDANAEDNNGRTPLSWAAEGGHEAVVRLLVARGDVAADSKDNNGRTPLSRAAGRGCEAVVGLLVARGEVAADSKDNDGQTPLSWAACWGNEAVVRLLLGREDVDANLEDNRGMTPLSWATISPLGMPIKKVIIRLLGDHLRRSAS